MDATIKPSRIYIDVTNACNLRCRHCCTSSGCRYEDELGKEEIISLIHQAKKMGITNLVFSGGEPLIRKDFFSILEYARNSGMEVTILTNGLLIDYKKAKTLIDLSVRVKISLDGACAETHDYLRGKGTFERTIDILRLMVKLKCETLTVHYTVHRLNFLELEMLPELLRKIGVPNLVIGTIKPAGRAQINSELLIPPRMVPFVHERVNSVKRNAGIRIMSFSDRGWGEFGCPASCNKLGITSTGFLTTCAFFGSQFLGGNIREHTLEELWQSHLARSDIFVANEKCKKCPYLPSCAGGCRARALYYYGDINAPDPYCCALYNKKVFIDENRPTLLKALENPMEAFS